jgi:hypothetical protein
MGKGALLPCLLVSCSGSGVWCVGHRSFAAFDLVFLWMKYRINL